MLAAQRLGELVGALADAVADNAAGVRAARHAAEALTGLLNSAPLER